MSDTATSNPATCTYVGLCLRGWYWEVVRGDRHGHGWCATKSSAWRAARRWARRNL